MEGMVNQISTNKIVQEDNLNIIRNLGTLVDKFSEKEILITGYQGFLGSNFLAFFDSLKQERPDLNFRVTLMDNNIVNLESVIGEYVGDFKVINGDVAKDLPDTAFDYIIHGAGIASPTFYRKFPLETIYVNAIGYWEMLQKLKADKLKGFLYFSTSEIYGDPDPKFIPTSEDYRGNVSCTGPRACYDESKRLGETISISFHQEKDMPIKIVRPFNVYGTFMRLNDKRVIPDFAKDALSDGVIKILSDGTPTRAFCYTSDAIEGFLRALLIGKPAQPYNIGNDATETSMKELAEILAEIIGGVEIQLAKSPDQNYLTDNPQRRLPVIDKARKELEYDPKVNVITGLKRIISWYKAVYNN